jgi:hypothetical protein
MDWPQVFTLLASNAALFMWARSESRQDCRHLDTKLDAIRELTHEIHLEMKDFHNRLCKIEENRNANHKSN